MNIDIVRCARTLRNIVNHPNGVDEADLAWIHGFLSALIEDVESRADVPVHNGTLVGVYRKALGNLLERYVAQCSYGIYSKRDTEADPEVIAARKLLG